MKTKEEIELLNQWISNNNFRRGTFHDYNWRDDYKWYNEYNDMLENMEKRVKKEAIKNSKPIQTKPATPPTPPERKKVKSSAKVSNVLADMINDA